MKLKIILALGLITILITSGAFVLLNQQVATPEVAGMTNTSELALALGKNELIIGIDEAFPPTSFKGSDGEYAGIDIDFARELSARTGIKLVFKPVEWDSIIPALLAKKIDAVWSGMGITPERQEKVNFVVYAKSPKGVAFVKADSGITSKEDLAGKVIAVQSGSYQETDLKEGKLIPAGSWKELRSMSTLPEAIMDLKIGRVDVVIAGQDSAGYYIKKTLNDSSGYKVVDVGYGMGTTGIAVRKEDAALAAALETEVNAIIQDGTAGKITEKWLGINKYLNWDN